MDTYRCIAAALEKNSTITNVDLCCNFLGDKDAGRTAEALEKNSSITNLNLVANKIRLGFNHAKEISLQSNCIVAVLIGVSVAAAVAAATAVADAVALAVA